MGQGVIVVCRQNSSRLPGKTLTPIGDRPLLWYVLSRLNGLSDAGISLCVATSDQWFDEPIAEYCASQGVDCFRGDSQDVAGRLIACAQSRQFTEFARVNGDSPFVDSELLRQAFHTVREGSLQFVTNLVPRSYPYGVATEVLDTAWYAEWMGTVTAAADREHVTSNLYQHLDQIRFANLFRSGGDLSQWSLTVDTPADLRWFRQFVADSSVEWTTLDYAAAIESIQGQRRAG